MFKWIEKLLRKDTKIKLEDVQKSFKIDCWYKYGNGTFVRITNIFENKDGVYLTTEVPVVIHDNKWKINKFDFCEPKNYYGLIELNKKENEKLEKSYWKSIEEELKSLSDTSKKEYNSFINFGNGYGNKRKK